MIIYNCDVCGHQIYFENTLCLSCGSQLGYLPLLDHVSSLESVDGVMWKSLAPQAQGALYRKCQNYYKENICNWMVPQNDPYDFCLSCRLNEMIPDLSIPENREYWHRLEMAKRRLVYTLLRLGLPLRNKKEDPENGLAFEFLADDEIPQEQESKRVFIGHYQGKITINIAEANDAIREKMRLDMNEEYRTLLGHFRHEIGHYYWFLLVENNQDLLFQFRQIFGNEEEDYGQALKHYYENGPVADWSQYYVCAYASAHPWEDWAESWAHYFHMFDALETAQALGLTAKFKEGRELKIINWEAQLQNFDTMKSQWGYLCATLNSLNRSMGMKDVYPFVLPQPGIEKLRFIHQVIDHFKERVSR